MLRAFSYHWCLPFAVFFAIIWAHRKTVFSTFFFLNLGYAAKKCFMHHKHVTDVHLLPNKNISVRVATPLPPQEQGCVMGLCVGS